MENQQQRTKTRNCQAQVPFFYEENIYCYTCFDTIAAYYIVNKCIIAVQHTKNTKKDLFIEFSCGCCREKEWEKKNKVNTTRLE